MANYKNPTADAPKPEKIERWIEEGLERYRDDRKRIEDIRSMRRLTWTVNVPKRLEDMTGLKGFAYHASDIADELMTLPTLYTSQLPSLAITAEGRGDTDELTTDIEAFTKAALFKDCGCRAEGPPTHERLYDGVFEGAGWTKLIRNPQAIWSDYLEKSAAGVDAKNAKGDPLYEDDPDPERKDDEDDDAYESRRKRKRTKKQKYLAATETAKKRAGVPLEWRFVDVMNVIPRYEGDVLRAVIEVQKRQLSDVFDDYGLGFDAKGDICPSDTAIADWEQKCTSREVEFIQYWDRTWVSYCVRYSGGFSGADSGYKGSCQRIPGHTYEHKYNLGRPPYFASWGSTANFEFGRLATWSAAETKRPAVEYLSFLRTMMAYLAIRDAIPPVNEEVPLDGAAVVDGETGQPEGPETYEAGMKYRTLPGTRMVPFNLPNNTATLVQEIAATTNDIISRGPTRVSGSLQGAGEAMATAFERDRAKYNQHEAAIVKHLREVTLAMWKLLEGLDEPVYVSAGGTQGYLKVEPSDFGRAMDPNWSLNVDSMAADMVREQYLRRRVEGRSLGQDQMIERLGDNPDQVHKAIAEQDTRASDTYRMALEKEILAHWGRGEWGQAQDVAEQLAAFPQQMASPQGAAPGMAVPAGANGQTSAGASIAPPVGQAPQMGGVVPGTPAPPSVSMPAAAAGTPGMAA